MLLVCGFKLPSSLWISVSNNFDISAFMNHFMEAVITLLFSLVILYYAASDDLRIKLHLKKRSFHYHMQQMLTY